MKSKEQQQKTFDKVVTHLFKQGTRALLDRGDDDKDTGCAYLNSKDLKCAVGCLIPDDLNPNIYKSELTVDFLVREFEELRELPDFSDIKLLSSLQLLHDIETNWTSDAAMHDEANEIAIEFDLTTDNIKDLSFST